MDNHKIFARNFNKYLMRDNLSKKDFAKKTDFKYDTVISWANGNKYPRMDKIEQIATFFGIQKQDLIEEKPGYKGLVATEYPAAKECANRITYARKRLNLSTAAVSSKTGIPEEQLKLMEENGPDGIRRDELIELARCLQSSPDYLLGFDSPDAEEDAAPVYEPLMVDLIDRLLIIPESKRSEKIEAVLTLLK